VNVHDGGSFSLDSTPILIDEQNPCRLARPSLSRATVEPNALVTASPAAGRTWIVPLARLGYAAKGVVYLLVGWIAATAAWHGGDTADSEDALAFLLAKPFGRPLLAIVALGLVGYSLWRVVQAVADPEHEGRDVKGLARRGYMLISALIHGALVLAALRLIGGGDGRDGDAARDGTARLMAAPMGRVLVALVGVLVLAAAMQQWITAWRRGYRRRLRLAELAPQVRRWVDPVARLGLVARGIVFAIVGGFLLTAAAHARPEEARGLGAALATLQRQPGGAWLLAVVAVGLIAYGVYQLVEARFRAIAPP
jgi:hypothetical protein